MFYDPYHLGRIEDRITNRFLCLHLRNMSTSDVGMSYYTILRKHFDALWLVSLDFEDYFLSNRELIARVAPSAGTLRVRHRH
jgi:hypothetical protein